jgi:NAD(P)-dependent dehydrogenase (short-subunit alcohol dehydrogenase family)
MGELDGSAVIVTGAGRGLGRAYALAAAAAGATVVVNDVDAEVAAAVAEEIEAAGGSARARAGSVASWAEAEALIAYCAAELGSVDGLVNNAGVLHAAAPWEETEAGLRQIVDVNLLGTMYCGAHALRAMRDQGRGSIVNVTSGAHLGVAEIGAYAATKGAIVSATYSWALATAGSGVRVNAIAPNAASRMAAVFLRGDQVEQEPPERVAPLVVYLLSKRSALLTGQVVRLDGTELSLLRPGRFGDGVRRSEWTVETIAEELESGPLAGDLGEVGMLAAAAAERRES